MLMFMIKNNISIDMKALHFTAMLAFCATLAVTGCGENATEKKAGELLEQAQQLFDKGDYVKATATIDSLRKNFPEALEARKKGLRLYQEAELKRAQGIVERADTALQHVEREYQEMKAQVDKLRETGAATVEQLRAVNLMRVKRDSLKTVFDVECAKIKYIKKMVDYGARKLEVTSFVSPKYVPQMGDAKEVFQGVKPYLDEKGVTAFVLTLNKRGVVDARAAGVHNVNFVLSASEEHNLRNSRRTIQESLDAFKELAEEAKDLHMTLSLPCAFGSPFPITARCLVDASGQR